MRIVTRNKYHHSENYLKICKFSKELLDAMIEIPMSCLKIKYCIGESFVVEYM
jgi:hypothetical protein